MRSLTQLSRAAVAALILAFVLSASINASAQMNVSDAVDDFSIESSTGVWSYGYTGTRGSKFASYNQAQVNLIPGLDVWSMVGSGGNPPSISHNTTGEPLNYLTISLPADLLNVHPGPGGENSVVRWTAQMSGMYQVTGRFQGLDVAQPTTTDVAVLHNSSETLFSGNINGSANPATFILYAYVEAGDTVDFSVGFGGNGYNHDSTGLAATIKRFEISGQVTDESGNGIGGTEVTLQTRSQITTATTDGDGRYWFDNMLVGRGYTVTALLTDCERGRFRYVPESYTFTALNNPQTANFVRQSIVCPPRTICRDEPPCPLRAR